MDIFTTKSGKKYDCALFLNDPLGGIAFIGLFEDFQTAASIFANSDEMSEFYINEQKYAGYNRLETISIESYGTQARMRKAATE